MAFSGNGQRLVAVTGDNRHSVHVFDWKRKELICPAEVGHNGQPPQVRDNEAVCWPCMHTRGWLPRSAAPLLFHPAHDGGVSGPGCHEPL